MTGLFAGCSQKHEAYVSPSTEIRDNTPLCLKTQAPGTEVLENDFACVDISNAKDGYIMVSYKGDKTSIVKLQITGPDYMTYTYNLEGHSYEAFPLSCGSGIYSIDLFENIEETQYATIFSETLDASIDFEWGAFLYPNQYVNFDESSEVVQAAMELVAPCHDDLEAINRVYDELVNTITYDEVKANTVESGYVPNVDEIWKTKTGICLDYAAVMASMLRSQQIPTRLEVGYAGTSYHAWISTYVKEIGWVNGIIQFDGETWSIMDPTFAANAGEDAFKSFIGDGENYVTKFSY